MSDVYKYPNILIKESSESIFDMPAQALVIPCNTAGIAETELMSEFKERYPEAYAHYSDRCKRGKFQSGSVLTYYIPGTDYFKRNETELIIFFPVKTQYSNISDYSLIEDSLYALAKCTISEKLYSIAIPPLEYLEKDKVKQMILDSYCPRVVKYLKMLYLPQS